MAFKKQINLEAAKTIALGGFNKETRKDNPTQITGYYLGSKQVEQKLGTSTIHYFDTSEGVVAVWGKTDLNRRLARIPASDYGINTRVTYVGTVPTPKGAMNRYEVELDADDRKDVTPMTSSEVSVSGGSYDENEDYEDDLPPLDELPPAPARLGAAKTAPTASAAKRITDRLKSAR